MRSEIVRAFHRVFTSPDGKVVMEELERQYGGSTLKKKNGVVDVHATVAASGSREVLMHIVRTRDATTE